MILLETMHVPNRTSSLDIKVRGAMEYCVNNNRFIPRAFWKIELFAADIRLYYNRNALPQASDQLATQGLGVGLNGLYCSYYHLTVRMQLLPQSSLWHVAPESRHFHLHTSLSMDYTK